VPPAAAAPVPPAATPYQLPYAPQYQAPIGNPYAAATPPPARSVFWRSTAVKCVATAAAALAIAAGSFAAGTTQSHTHVVQVPAASGNSGSPSDPFGQFGFGNGTSPDQGGSSQGDGSDGSGFGFGGSDGSNSSNSATASSAQSVGVVDINTTLGYQEAQAAGTGMVMDSNGDVLTNNHVVNGATSIKVTVVSTGATYTAKVVGTDPTQDIAVIRLVDASGLKVANFGDSDSVKVGAAVTGVGNAGGVGGTPSAAAGKVLALNQSITASDDSGSDSERLPNVIVTDAPIQAGDSGGPLYDSSNHIVGIDTAANTSGTTQGFAIPINTARSLAGQILSGHETSTIHIGLPAFLGISVEAGAGSTGTTVSGVVQNGPAAGVGIVQGDQITKVGSTSTPNPTALHNALASKNPGDRTTITYVDQSGASHTATVTLASGPAD
jgi:S1-C subfamily serine protease